MYSVPMKFLYNIGLLFLLGTSSLDAVFVRVLLEETTCQTWVISNPEGMVVRDGVTKKEIPLKATFFEFDISVNKNNIHINSCLFERTQLWIEPLGKQACAVNGQPYDGRLLLVRSQNSWLLMSVVGLEEYVFSVLKTESWPGWPLEVQKVLAIASRSYVLYQLLTAREKKLAYHIRNTNHHQTYTGSHGCPVIRQAVKETERVFLGYNGKPILAMFDCCCGGIIPAKSAKLVDFKKAPYLARDYACTYCKTCKLYSWSASYSLEQLRQLVQEVHDAMIHDIKDIHVDHHDDAGLVKKIALKTKKNTITLTAQQLYKALKDIKSHCYAISKRGATVTFTGRGYGHHVGLCQWGARTMVDEGWDYQDILMFYYPGTQFMLVEKTTPE